MTLQPTDLSVKSTVCSSVKQQPNAVKESKCDAAVPNSGHIEVGQTSDLKEASESLVDSTTLGEGKFETCSTSTKYWSTCFF